MFLSLNFMTIPNRLCLIRTNPSAPKINLDHFWTWLVISLLSLILSLLSLILGLLSLILGLLSLILGLLSLFLGRLSLTAYLLY